jgi:hypothetical protein
LLPPARKQGAAPDRPAAIKASSKKVRLVLERTTLDHSNSTPESGSTRRGDPSFDAARKNSALRRLQSPASRMAWIVRCTSCRAVALVRGVRLRPASISREAFVNLSTRGTPCNEEAF